VKHSITNEVWAVVVKFWALGWLYIGRRRDEILPVDVIRRLIWNRDPCIQR